MASLGVMVLMVCLSVSFSRKAEKTLYACEGETAHLNCSEGRHIQIIRANYGRFSVHQCNSDGTDWANTQCSNGDSVRIMTQLCSNRQECLVAASNKVFQYDPCPTTSKYLQVEYNCSASPVTTIPPTAKPAQPTFTSTATKSPVASKFERTEVTEPPTPSPTKRLQSTVSTTESPTKPQFCPEIKVRNVVWPTTYVGHNSKQPCPNNPDNRDQYAKWDCGHEGHWVPARPDLSLCESDWSSQMEETVVNVNSEPAALEMARALQTRTRHKDMYGGDTIASTNVLGTLADRATAILALRPADDDRKHYATQLADSVVDSANNLVQDRNLAAWHDLPSDKQIRAAVSLMDGVEQTGHLMADSMTLGSLTETKHKENILLEVTVIKVADYLKFPSASFYDDSFDSIQVPEAILRGKENKDIAKVIFASYDHLSEFLEPPTRFEEIDGRKVAVESRVVSRILTATVADVTAVKSDRPVVITFRTDKSSSDLSNARCVWWDRRIGNLGAWSGSGCALSSTNSTHTVCACDHLTNFAVLMDIHGVQIDIEHQIALSYITYIGCVISIVCLLITLVALCVFGGAHADRAMMHKNLCFCLLVAEVLFIFGVPQVQWRIPCMVIALCLHYFFLCAFAWMLLEGYELYTLLVKVWKTEMDDWQRIACYVFAYGMPLIIVAISFAVDQQSYGTSTHCWLRADNYFILSFVGPVVVVLLANFVFLIISLTIICQHRTRQINGYNRCRHDPEMLDSVRVWLRGSISLVVLLGLTWAFGLLYMNKSTVYFAYIFTALNSLQGLFIFIFQVVCNKKVQQRYNRWTRKTSNLGVAKRTYAFNGKGGYIAGGSIAGGSLSREFPSSPLSSPLPPSTNSSDSNSAATFHGKWSHLDPRYNSAAPLLMKPGLYDQYDYGYQMVVPVSDDAEFAVIQASPLPQNRPPAPKFPPPAPPYYDISQGSNSPRLEPHSKLSDDSAYEEGRSMRSPGLHVLVESHERRPDSGDDFIGRDLSSPESDVSPRQPHDYEIPKSAVGSPTGQGHYRSNAAFV